MMGNGGPCDTTRQDNVYSMYLAVNAVRGHSFVLINGDVVFENCLIQRDTVSICLIHPYWSTLSVTF